MGRVSLTSPDLQKVCTPLKVERQVGTVAFVGTDIRDLFFLIFEVSLHEVCNLNKQLYYTMVVKGLDLGILVLQWILRNRVPS